jgi:hypothetical protein
VHSFAKDLGKVGAAEITDGLDQKGLDDLRAGPSPSLLASNIHMELRLNTNQLLHRLAQISSLLT